MNEGFKSFCIRLVATGVHWVTEDARLLSIRCWRWSTLSWSRLRASRRRWTLESSASRTSRIGEWLRYQDSHQIRSFYLLFAWIVQFLYPWHNFPPIKFNSKSGLTRNLPTWQIYLSTIFKDRQPQLLQPPLQQLQQPQQPPPQLPPLLLPQRNPTIQNKDPQ